MTERDSIAALVSDLHWQIDQLKVRGIKDRAGNPYNPSYYKRGLQNAIERGGLEVAAYVRRYVHKTPSDGYQKLEDADSLDLACEWLVADAGTSYAQLFSEEDRAAAQARLAPHVGAIAARKAAVQRRIDTALDALPPDLPSLRALPVGPDAERMVAVNLRISSMEPGDPVALNRLGRAYEMLGRLNDAIETFERALAVDGRNTIAKGRLEQLRGRQR